MSNHQRSNRLPYGLILLAMASGIVLGLAMSQNGITRSISSSSPLSSKVEQTLDLINSQYVDLVDDDSLSSEMLNAMLNTLDPHSRYLSVEEMGKEAEQLQGHFDGIGVVLRRVGDTSCVGQVFEGGPAHKEGLLPGDRIVTIDGEPVAEEKKTADEVVKMIRGRRNSVVDLGIMRRGQEGIGHYKVRRHVVKTPTVNYAAMLDSRNGYIRISSFADNTFREFHEELLKLKSQGMKRLIIDLRGNGGGLLETSLQIANDLLPKDQLIVYTEGAHQRRSDVNSTGRGSYTEGELVVLIDEYSASASEVLAGAIQDNDRGTIVGRRSFGKGLVQGQFSLPDGSALWLTTARYYTPSGRSIQKPYTNGYEQYYLSNYQQALEESFSDSISATLNDTTKYYTKKGRVLYGAGGIVPDKIVPVKRYDDILYYNLLANKMVMFDYSFEYVTRNIRSLMKTYATAEQFEAKFQVTDEMLEELAAMGASRDVPRNPKALAAHKQLMKRSIKSYIGQSLFGDNLYYKIILADDDEVSTAKTVKMI